jgi:hypothetical protein
MPASSRAVSQSWHQRQQLGEELGNDGLIAVLRHHAMEVGVVVITESGSGLEALQRLLLHLPHHRDELRVHRKIAQATIAG